MFRNLNNCRNIKDFQLLAKKRLPSAIFHYIDGAAEDESTYHRNTNAFEEVDLVPNVLKDVSNPQSMPVSDVLIPVLIFFPLMLYIFAKKYSWSDWNGKLFGKIEFTSSYISSAETTLI